MKYSGTKIEEFVDKITIRQFGRGCYLLRDVEEADKQAAREGLQECRSLLSSGNWDLVILDRSDDCAVLQTVSHRRAFRHIRRKKSAY